MNGLPLLSLRVGTIVRADSSLAEIQTLNGSLLSADSLGLGVVREVGPAGAVKVHWFDARLDAWVQEQDVFQQENTRLLTIHVIDKTGKCKATRTQFVKSAGLRFNWIVEMLPRNLIRTMRPDGYSWIFEWHPLFKQAHPLHTMILEGCQLNDDEAEALTVAEAAVKHKK